jgi:hypothetical protein
VATTFMAEAELPVMGTGAGAATMIEGRLPPPPAGLTVVRTLAELLAALGSATVEVTETVLETIPGPSGVTVIAALSEVPALMVPRAQVTVPEVFEHPEEADVKVTPDGRGSEATAPVASEGPALEATIV